MEWNRLGRLAGAVGVVLLWLAIAAAGLLAPGYSQLHHAVSVLGMRGAAHPWILDDVGLPLFALGAAVTGALVAREVRPRFAGITAGTLLVLVAVGALLVGFSPCQSRWCAPSESPLNARHVIGTLMAFWLAPLAALVLGACAVRRGPDRGLCSFSLAMALAMIGAHVLLQTAVFDPQHQWFGFWQRLVIAAISAWVFGVSVGLWRRAPAIADR